MRRRPIDVFLQKKALLHVFIQATEVQHKLLQKEPYPYHLLARIRNPSVQSLQKLFQLISPDYGAISMVDAGGLYPNDVLIRNQQFDTILKMLQTENLKSLIPFFLNPSGNSIFLASIKEFRRLRASGQKTDEIISFLRNLLSAHHDLLKFNNLINYDRRQSQNSVSFPAYSFNMKDAYGQTALMNLFQEPVLLNIIVTDVSAYEFLDVWLRHELMQSDALGDYSLHKLFDALHVRAQSQEENPTIFLEHFSRVAAFLKHCNSLIQPEFQTKNRQKRCAAFFAPSFIPAGVDFPVQFPCSNQDVFQRTPLLYVSRVGKEKFSHFKEWFQNKTLDQEVEVADRMGGFCAYYLLMDQVKESDNQLLGKLGNQLTQVFSLNGCTGLNMYGIFENAEQFQTQIKLKLDQSKQDSIPFCGLSARQCNHYQGYFSSEREQDTASYFHRLFQLKVEHLFAVFQRVGDHIRDVQMSLKSYQNVTVASQLIMMLVDGHLRNQIDVKLLTMQGGSRVDVTISNVKDKRQFTDAFLQFLSIAYKKIYDHLHKLSFCPYYFFIKAQMLSKSQNLDGTLSICKIPVRMAAQIASQWINQEIVIKMKGFQKMPSYQIPWMFQVQPPVGFRSCIDSLGLVVGSDKDQEQLDRIIE